MRRPDTILWPPLSPIELVMSIYKLVMQATGWHDFNDTQPICD